MTGSWRTDVAIMESLEIRIKRESDPKQRAIWEIALAQHLASNPHLRPKTSAEPARCPNN